MKKNYSIKTINIISRFYTKIKGFLNKILRKNKHTKKDKKEIIEKTNKTDSIIIFKTEKKSNKNKNTLNKKEKSEIHGESDDSSYDMNISSNSIQNLHVEKEKTLNQTSQIDALIKKPINKMVKDEKEIGKENRITENLSKSLEKNEEISLANEKSKRKEKVVQQTTRNSQKRFFKVEEIIKPTFKQNDKNEFLTDDLDTPQFQIRKIEAKSPIIARKVYKHPLERKSKENNQLDNKIKTNHNKKITSTSEKYRHLRPIYLGQKEVIMIKSSTKTKAKRNINFELLRNNQSKDNLSQEKHKAKQEENKTKRHRPKIIIDMEEELVNLVISDRIIPTNSDFNSNNLGNFKISMDDKEIKIKPNFVKNKDFWVLKELKYALPTPFKEFKIRFPRSLQNEEIYEYYHNNSSYYIFLPDIHESWRMHWLYDYEKNIIPIPKNTNKLLVLYDRNQFKEIEHILRVIQEDFSLNHQSLEIKNTFQIHKQFWQGNFLLLEITNIKEYKKTANVFRKTTIFKFDKIKSFKDNLSNNYPLILGQKLEINANPPSQTPVNISLQHLNKDANFYTFLAKNWNTEEPIVISFPENWPSGNYQLTFSAKNDNRALQTYNLRWMPDLSKNHEIFKFPEYPIFPDENGHQSHLLSLNLDSNKYRINISDHSIPLISIDKNLSTVNNAVDPCLNCIYLNNNRNENSICEQCNCKTICAWGIEKICPFTPDEIENNCPISNGESIEIKDKNTQILFKDKVDRIIISLRQWKPHFLRMTVPYSELKFDITVPKIRWRFSNEDNWKDRAILLTKQEFRNTNKQHLVIRTNHYKEFPFKIELLKSGNDLPIISEKNIISPSDTEIPLGSFYDMIDEENEYYIKLSADYPTFSNSPNCAILMKICD